MERITFTAWIHYHRRTELLAQHLGATLHFIQHGRSGKVLQAPFRYLVQAIQTWHILGRERPAIILIQNPPIFCVLVVALYAKLHGARYVIDSHTGAFVGWRWRWSLPLHRMLSQGALTTLVHNKSQEEIIKNWGCPYMMLAYTPGDYSLSKPFPLDGQFNIAVVSSFRGDERPDIVFQAAARLPQVKFYMTGDPGYLSRTVLKKRPSNCHLTGYLPYDRYAGLLQGVDAIMALTTRDHTLLMGGFEAVSMGKPLITSEWPVLSNYFSLGTIHVSYTVEGICRGVHRVQAEHSSLQRDMLKLRDLLENEWKLKLQELKDLLAEGADGK